MNKLYRKSELGFALAWIGAYVVLTSLGDNLSNAIGVQKSATLAVHLLLSATLLVWISNNGMMEKYGLCRAKLPAGRMLCYLPLAVIALSGLIGGVGLRYSPVETALFVFSMLCVGLLEEVIFRGLLYRAIARDGETRAIVISSLTFGLGHIVNAFNGSGQSLPDTLLQIVFAIAVGFALMLVFYRTGSLIPCIVFHGVNNAMSAFTAEGVFDPRLELAIDLALIIIVTGGYLLYLAYGLRRVRNN